MRPPCPPRRRTREQFLPCFAIAFLGSIGWQLGLLLAAALVASSPTLRQHTRHQDDLAALLWLGGTGLHVLALVLLIGRSRGNGAAGVWTAVLLLTALAYGAGTLISDLAQLRD